MANNLVQFRVDGQTRLQATAICSQLGIDLQSYLRMCMTRLVDEKGIPFSMRIADCNNGIAAMRRAQQISAERGTSEMTLEQINAEIEASRG